MSGMTIGEFADRVSEVTPVIMREFMKKMYGDFSKHKISMPQIFILDILDKQKETRMTDLAKFLNVSTASVTGVTDKLVREAYVERERGSEDRRVVRIRLTQKGARFTETMNRKRKAVMMKMFGKISQSDRETYLRILGQIKQGAEGAEGEGK